MRLETSACREATPWELEKTLFSFCKVISINYSIIFRKIRMFPHIWIDLFPVGSYNFVQSILFCTCFSSLRYLEAFLQINLLNSLRCSPSVPLHRCVIFHLSCYLLMDPGLFSVCNLIML